MSEEKKEEAAPAPSGGGGSKVFMILALVNTLAVLGVAGLMVYTKLLFKRPPITEAQERARLEKIKERKAKDTQALVPGLITFDPVTVNIRTTPGQARTTETGNVEGKLHYATIGFALEIKDNTKIPQLEELRPMFMDKLMSLLGRKGYGDLTTVQGRFLLRTQILDAINDLITTNQHEKAAAVAAHKKKEAEAHGGSAPASSEPGEEEEKTAESRDVLVTNIYFTQFIVQ